MKKNTRINFGTALFILVLSSWLLYYSYNLPCDVKISQEVQGQSLDLDLGPELGRVVCLGSDFKAVILSLLGFIGVWSSGSKIYNMILGDK